MLGSFFPYFLIGLVLLLVNQLLKWNLNQKRDDNQLHSIKPLSADQVISLLQKYGTNSNSFLSLYPGFEFFTSADPQTEGFIAFTRTRYGWVVAADPVTSPDRQMQMLAEFSAAAEKANKVVVVLPVPEKLALAALQAGFHSVMIGCEPTFNLTEYPPAGKAWNEMQAVARQLANKGATVSEFFPDQLSDEERTPLNEITDLWLKSRKMEPLSFLNQVDPWLFSNYKRYFKIDLNGKTPAFVASIPIMARKGWYLIDTMRHPESPTGTTELLMLQSMRLLTESGALEVSLGVSPLSEMEKASQSAAANPEQNRNLYKLLKWVYDSGNLFYAFNTLYQYKMKFKPSSAPAVFALIRIRPYKNKLLETIRICHSISQAMMPKGVALATFLNVLRVISSFSLSDFLRNQVSYSIIVRSTPSSWSRLVRRCKTTVALLILNVFAFLIIKSPAEISSNSFEFLFISPWLHWSGLHLAWDLLAVMIFTGLTEYFAGSSIAFLSFFISNLIATTTIGFLIHLKVVDPGPAVYLGSYLGALGNAGSLFFFLRNRSLLMGLIIILSWLCYPFNSFPFLLMQPLAILVGAVITKIAVSRNR